MQVSWGSLGDTGIVQVIIEPVLKPAHQYLFWPIHTACQVSEFLHVFAYEPVALPTFFMWSLALRSARGSSNLHLKAVIKWLKFWNLFIMEGHAAAPSRARVITLTHAPLVGRSLPIFLHMH